VVLAALGIRGHIVGAAHDGTMVITVASVPLWSSWKMRALI
jgi:hypothetical protein